MISRQRRCSIKRRPPSYTKDSYSSHGGEYRHTTSVLRHKYHLYVPRETVRTVLQQLDPTSVSLGQRHRLLRRTYWSRVPNHYWHVDGYNKLSPYGFSISGCTDGYLRHIIWIECASSNPHPGVIAYYFNEAIKKYGGCPKIVHTDCGTENVQLAYRRSYNRISQLMSTGHRHPTSELKCGGRFCAAAGHSGDLKCSPHSSTVRP